MDENQAEDPLWIPQETYDVIVDSVPIVCVDLLVVNQHGGSITLIERLTHSGQKGLNLVGGGVRLDEDLGEALTRHVITTLGPDAFLQVDSVTQFGVYQYFKTPRPGRLHDPRKNAVSVSFYGRVSGSFQATGEALELHEYPIEKPPELHEFGFGQGPVVYDGLQQITRAGAFRATEERDE